MPVSGNPSNLGGGFGFLIPSEAVLPVTDTVFLGAPAEIRDQIELVAATAILNEKRQALLLGESATGGRLQPIHALTKLARDRNINPTVPPKGRKPYSPVGRASSANAPLVATGANARAVQLLRVSPVPGGLWVYWNKDPHTGKYWGQILGLHAVGFVQKFYWPRRKHQRPREAIIPSRDTIGLSPARIARVRNIVSTRWQRMRPSVQKMQELENVGVAGTSPRRRSAAVVEYGGQQYRAGDHRQPAFGSTATRQDDRGIGGLGRRIASMIGGLFR